MARKPRLHVPGGLKNWGQSHFCNPRWWYGMKRRSRATNFLGRPRIGARRSRCGACSTRSLQVQPGSARHKQSSLLASQQISFDWRRTTISLIKIDSDPIYRPTVSKSKSVTLLGLKFDSHRLESEMELPEKWSEWNATECSSGPINTPLPPVGSAITGHAFTPAVHGTLCRQARPSVPYAACPAPGAGWRRPGVLRSPRQAR